MGGGKSYALCAEALRLSLDYPGNAGVIARKEFKTLRRTTMVTFERLVPMELYTLDRTQWVATIKNGSKIYFTDCMEPDKFKSMEIGWFGIDEATEVPKQAFEILTTRLRHRLPTGKCPRYTGFLASNPAPGWVKERFITKQLVDHKFIPALPSDNPYLPTGYVDGVREANEGNTDFIKAYLEGSWNVFAGQVYKDFARDKHVVDPFPIPKEYAHYIGVDVGGSNPWAIVFMAISPDGDVIVYDEIYEKEKSTEWFSEQIKNRVGQRSIRGYFIDPAAKQARLDFEQRYHVRMQPARNDVKGGIAEVKKYWPVNHFTGKPKLVIFKHCVNLIWELEQYAWAKNADGSESDRPVKINDHACDALRYILATYQQASREVSVDSYVARYGTAFRRV